MSIHPDPRYTVNAEYNGTKYMYALRFAGEFICYCKGIDEADNAAVTHSIKGHNLKAWRLLATLEGVLWLRKGRIHRVAYGAQVKDFKGHSRDVEAAKNFGLCVRHSLECSGEL